MQRVRRRRFVAQAGWSPETTHGLDEVTSFLTTHLDDDPSRQRSLLSTLQRVTRLRADVMRRLLQLSPDLTQKLLSVCLPPQRWRRWRRPSYVGAVRERSVGRGFRECIGSCVGDGTRGVESAEDVERCDGGWSFCNPSTLKQNSCSTYLCL